MSRFMPDTRTPAVAVAATVALVLSVSLVASAWADPKAHRPPIDALPDASGKVKLTAIFYDEDPDTGKTAVLLSRYFRLHLKKDGRFAYFEVSKLLEQGKLADEVETIDRAREAFDRGAKLFETSVGKTAEAATVLETAVESYRGVLGYVPTKAEFVEALLYWASALYLNGDKEDARTVLREVLLLEPELHYDDERFPARMVKIINKVKDELIEAPRGSVEIKSDPSFAEVYVNGVYRGVTPIEVFGLPAGENYISVRKDGYRKYAGTIEVEGEKSSDVEVPLDEVFRYPIYEGARKNAIKELGEPKAGSAVREAGAIFVVDQIIFTRLSDESGATRAEVYLYDMRSRLLLKKVSGTIPARAGSDELRSAVGKLLTTLYTDVRLDGSIERPEDELAIGKRKRKPIYNRWWFWTGVGVVAAGAGAGAGIGAYLLTRPPPRFFCAGCTAASISGF